MHIYGPTQLHGAQPVNTPHASKVSRPTTPPTSAPIHDELQLSDASRLVEEVGQIPDIRQDRVDAIRSQIANGTYETDAKLDIAMNRLLDEIG